MIRCIKEYNSYEGKENDFVVGNNYSIESSDTFGIYVKGEQGTSVYFDDDEELLEYFE